LTVEGGLRWVFWPPWYSTTNNIANFDPRFFDRNNAAVINPSTGRLVSGPRYNGVVLPGDGFEGDATNSPLASDPAVTALFRGEPRGFSEMHYNAIEPRLGASYRLNDQAILRVSSGIFHNRVTLNDSTLLGGNPPFQPQVTIANGSADSPGGGTLGSADLPFAINGQDVVFKHPTSYMYSVGVQREVPFWLHRGSELRGAQGPLPAARAEHQSVAARHDPGKPRREHRGAAAVHGLRRHSHLGERRPLEVQQSADHR
jgi:hypothetical protein